MKTKICLLILLLLPSLAAAAPSVKGSTGNIDTPSADVLRPGQVAIGYYNLDGEKSTVGTISAGKDIEVSTAYTADRQKDNFTKVNIKYAVAQEGVFSPGVAVGVEDIGDRSECTAYVVASKSLPQGIRLHDIVILNTIGELGKVYSIGDVVYVGGSLIEHDTVECHWSGGTIAACLCGMDTESCRDAGRRVSAQ